MQRGFNPLADILSVLWSIASALPPLPPPPEAPKPRAAEPLGSPSTNYVDANDSLLQASIENFRAEQRAKGLVPFVYE